MNPDEPQALESTLAAYRRLPQAEPTAALVVSIPCSTASMRIRPCRRAVAIAPGLTAFTRTPSW